MLLVCLLLVLVMGPVSSRAGTIRHDVNDSLYTALAQDEAYEAVGMITWTSGGSGGLASGTLIAGQWVLTAGHVIDDANLSTLTFEVGGVTYSADQMIACDDWTGDVSLAGDLALIRLEETVDTVTAAKLYTGDSEVGSVTTVVGFGMTGTGLTGAIDDAGTKRAGTNLVGGLGDVIGYSAHTLMADLDYPDPYATGKAICLDMEYLAAPGDSGGGWFIEADGVTYLAGVTSFGFATDGYIDSDYGDIMGATRISDYLDWIFTTVYANSLAGDLNGDGFVGIADLDLVLENWNSTVIAGNIWSGDASGDGFVGLDDLDVVLDHWNTGTLPSVAMPEPASVLLMQILLLLLLRRDVP